MRCAGIFAVFLVLAACSGSDEPRPEPVVVYAPAELADELTPRFEAFEAATGVPVAAKWGETAALTQALIDKTGLPADVLIADPVAAVWQAAEEGALRPIEATAFDAIATELRDPDGYWAAIAVRTPVFVARTEAALPAELDRLFPAPGSSPELCLAGFDDAANRALLAHRIDRDGVSETETAFRRLLQTGLARPLAEDADAVLEAIVAGDCAVGIVMSDAVPDAMASAPVDGTFHDAVSIAIGRHARQPESAQRMVAWLLDEAPIGPPGTVRPVIAIGYRGEEARLLAERVAWH